MKNRKEFLIENINNIIKDLEYFNASYICICIKYNCLLSNEEKTYLFNKFRARLRKVGIKKLNNLYMGNNLVKENLSSNNFYCKIRSRRRFGIEGNAIFRTKEARIKFLIDWKQDLINGRKKD